MKFKITKKNTQYFKILIILLLIITALVLIDIFTKIIFEKTLTYGVPVVLIPGILSLQFEKNTGAAFSLFSNSTPYLIAFSVVVIIALFVYDYFLKAKNRLYYFAFVLIIAGGIGNLIDRLFLGYVRDFIRFDFINWLGIFNFADAFLTIGLILYAVFILFYHDKLLLKQNTKK